MWVKQLGYLSCLIALLLVTGCNNDMTTQSDGDAGSPTDGGFTDGDGDSGIDDIESFGDGEETQGDDGEVSKNTFSISFDAGGYERLKWLIPTSDNNFIFAGDTNSFGTSNYGAWIVKTTDQGMVLWSQALSGDRWEEFVKIIELSDGSLIAAGQSDTNAGHKDQIFIVKFSSTGQILWQKLYGDTSGATSYKTEDLLVTPEGGFLVVGTKRIYADSSPLDYDDFDLYVLKTTSTGEISWQKTFGDLCWQLGHTAINQAQGKYIIAASTRGSFSGSWSQECWTGNPGQHDPFIWLIELDANGSVGLSEIYGGANGIFPRYMKSSPDGGYYLTATGYWEDYDFDGNYFKDMVAISLDNQMNIVWSKAFGDKESDHDTRSGLIGSDNGLYLAGLHDASIDENTVGHTHGFLAKLSDNGNALWQRSYHHRDYDEIKSLHELSDGSLLLGGKIQSYSPQNIYQAWILTTDSNGIGCNPDQGLETTLPFDIFHISRFIPVDHLAQDGDALVTNADCSDSGIPVCNIIDTNNDISVSNWCE